LTVLFAGWQADDGLLGGDGVYGANGANTLGEAGGFALNGLHD
jgi:hypothetical protein